MVPKKLPALLLGGIVFALTVYLLSGKQAPKLLSKQMSRQSSEQEAQRQQPGLTLGFSPMYPTGVFHASLYRPQGNKTSSELRAMQEMALTQRLLDALKDAPRCDGITLVLDGEKAKRANFAVAVWYYKYESSGEESWVWMLGDRRSKGPIGGMGNNDTAEKVAADICKTLWEDVDPNHFKGPGVRIE